MRQIGIYIIICLVLSNGGPDRFPKQNVKLEFVKQKWTVTYIMWTSGFDRLYNDSVYDMYAPVAIQDNTL